MHDEFYNFSNFWVVGINYKKADVSIRGDYAINIDQYINLLHLAPSFGVSEMFVISTCNRTEIYALADCPFLLKKLLCTQTKGSIDTLNTQSYTLRGEQAIRHLYGVSAGLDSQILGDYEIVGQIKEAIRISKDHQGIGVFTDKLFQSILQSARDIRSKTQLSSGSVSVAYAAFQYIISNAKDLQKDQILIIGTGKMGIASCKNLLQIIPKHNIAISNRTNEKAIQLAEQLGVHHIEYGQVSAAIEAADIVIIATNADEPIVKVDNFSYDRPKTFIDLSIPSNVAAAVGQLPDITLINVDELSRHTDDTLLLREGEVPKALEIIDFHYHQFHKWSRMRKNVPFLKVIKEKIIHIHNEHFAAHDGLEVEKIVKTMANKMKHDNSTPGCTCIETLHSYIAHEQNSFS